MGYDCATMSGTPKSRKTFWGEEKQRRERTFRVLHGNERYKVCDDEARRRCLTGAGIEKRDSENTADIGRRYDPHAGICLT